MRDELKDFIEGAQYVAELSDALQKEAEKLRTHSSVIVPTVYQTLSAYIKQACDEAGLVCYNVAGKSVDLIPVSEAVDQYRADLRTIAQSLEEESEVTLRESDPELPADRIAPILRACHHMAKELREALDATEGS